MTEFAAGDPCMLYDTKGRRYLIELIAGKDFHYHRGVLPHDVIIGSPDGTVHESSLGSRLIALRPRLADYTLKMSRGATVVYPKDTGAIVVWADIAPGMTVVEAGTGSGGLTMALVRAVGSTGRVVSVERRDDHATRAEKLIRGFFGEIPAALELRRGDVEDVIAGVAPDRIVLDLPEPWHSVALAAEHLVSGGLFCCYLPTVPQVQTVRDALAGEERFFDATTFEVLHREWAVDGRSVRPGHRMVGHTGFITTARRISP
jgi:tRNA (adenine57-N1/adenine58-N1)-methyltransferase